MRKLLSVQEAAEKLGVSPSTFKRCCELHQITLYRTPGGHRRIADEDLDQLIQIAGCRSPRAYSEEDVVAPSEIVGLLRKGEAKVIADRIWSLVRDIKTLPVVLEDTLAPALWTVGTLWLGGELRSYEEKICINTASATMDILSTRLPTGRFRHPVIVGGTFAPSRDTIASKMIALSALSQNIEAWDLGCGITPSTLADAAIQLRATCVWVCHTHIDDPERIVADHNALRSELPSDIHVVVGGGGLSPALRRLISHAEYHHSIASFLQTLSLCNRCPNYTT